ncbi:MAG TPA: hypothetical protein VEA41_07965 [Salinarimonas sp.]|nr:hypothetical protein [Salinarimonas sp.]
MPLLALLALAVGLLARPLMPLSPLPSLVYEPDAVIPDPPDGLVAGLDLGDDDGVAQALALGVI